MLKNKMKKMISVVVLVMIMALGCTFTGCGPENLVAAVQGSNEEDLAQNVSLVLGVHKYFPVINLNTESVYEQIYEACYTYGNLSAVVVDGEPYVACNYSIQQPDKKIDNAKRKQIAAQNASQIMNGLSAVCAKTPEIDTLSSITLSADSLNSVSGETKKTMLIFDSGLSTASLLNFSTQNWFEEPVESIVTQLKELHALPDLTDIEVVWYGLGKTCGEQANLTSRYTYNLQAIWEAILKEAGASKVTFDKSPISAEEYTVELPECSTVPVVADTLEPAPTGSAAETELAEILKWDGNSSVTFNSDEATFKDKDAAITELKPVAEYLIANQEEKIYIFGMTATTPGGSLGIELSKERADTCKNTLIELGANESQITTVGLGHLDNALRVKDIDEAGNQIEEQAQKNRAVVVIKADSEMVGVLLNIAEQLG